MTINSRSNALSNERQAATVWRYRRDYSGPELDHQLLENEFLQPAERLQKKRDKLRRILLHCYDTVPFYRNLWFANRIRRRQLEEIEDLSALPTLNKASVMANANSLRASKVMDSQRIAGHSRTSGTTGQPVEILHSDTSMSMFPWLKQRELRWFRYDPQGSMLSIRPGEELARLSDGSRWPDGDVLRTDCWPYLHEVFETGPATGFASTNRLDKQLELLNEVLPDYLLTEPATLENLSMQSLGKEFLENLKGLQTVSQTLTSDMRESISNVFTLPVFQNYGLNEIGLVASMCLHNRYHVHEEHCHVELVKENGEAAQVGERGRILVTSLTNSAMPLIRYETEDTAERADDECECGRSLMSFVNVEGRYRRLAQLPPGSYQGFKAIQATVNSYARGNPGAIQRYQVCQQESGDFELRIHCTDAALLELNSLVPQAFQEVFSDSTAPFFSLAQNAAFKGLEKRKFQIFYSELMPA